LYLLRLENFEVVGVTVPGSGEIHCSRVQVVLEELFKIGEHPLPPIACGGHQSLDGFFTFPKDWRQGADTLNGWLDLTAVTEPYPIDHNQKDFFNASRLIHDILENEPNVEIIATGPLTNIALALNEKPQLAKKIKNLWIMGGAVGVPGNIASNPYPSIDHLNNTAAEWNIWTDIRAAHSVFNSQLPIKLIPLDATNSVPISKDYVTDFSSLATATSSPAAQFVAWNFNLPFISFWLEEDRFYFWDTLAVGIANDASQCLQWKDLSLDVDITTTTLQEIYTDEIKPNHSETTLFGKPRQLFHPLLAGALIENDSNHKISVCMKADRDRFLNEFQEKLLQSSGH
ncbi:MAG: nucleoside hydrolase, partial [Pseudomonadota bacterium]